MNDILNLNEDLALPSGRTIHDVACPIHYNLIHDLEHSYSLQNMSLEDRINKIRLSIQSCDKLKNNCTKLYENLKRHKIEDKLHQRKIKTYHTVTLEQVRKLLESEMHGMQRLPSLFFQQSYV